MKSAYELAMERLNKASPTVPLSAGQKAELAELDSKYAAKIAEREISLQGEADKAGSAGDVKKAGEMQEQLVRERKALHADLEEKKEQVRRYLPRKLRSTPRPESYLQPLMMYPVAKALRLIPSCYGTRYHQDPFP